MNKFCDMTDEYIMSCHIILSTPPYVDVLPPEHFQALVKAKHIIEKLDRHDLFPHVYTYISDHI